MAVRGVPGCDGPLEVVPAPVGLFFDLDVTHSPPYCQGAASKLFATDDRRIDPEGIPLSLEMNEKEFGFIYAAT
jgi:hypothetical protein